MALDPSQMAHGALVTYNINKMNIFCFSNKFDLLRESCTVLTLLNEDL